MFVKSCAHADACSENQVSLFAGPSNKDCASFGSTLGPSSFGNPISTARFLYLRSLWLAISVAIYAGQASDTPRALGF